MEEFIQYYPNVRLLAAILLLVLVDLITGVMKATIQKKRRTSKGFRQTLMKFIQYGGCVIISMILLNLIQGKNSEFTDEFALIFGDLMLFIIIYIEVVSIFENMEEISPNTMFVTHFIRPVRRLITFRMKNLISDVEPKEKEDEK